MKRRDCLLGLGAGAAMAAAAVGSPSHATTGTDGDVTAEIDKLLRQTEERWNAQDSAALRELWDADDVEPFYLAGEQENWFVGWPAINAYLAPQGKPKITEAIRVRFYDLRVRRLASDLAFAAYWMRTDMKVVFSQKPFGTDNRVSAVFRRKPAGWRYVCYAEAFQAPTIYLQKLIEKDVPPDYADFYRRSTGRQLEGGR